MKHYINTENNRVYTEEEVRKYAGRNLSAFQEISESLWQYRIQECIFDATQAWDTYVVDKDWYDEEISTRDAFEIILNIAEFYELNFTSSSDTYYEDIEALTVAWFRRRCDADLTPEEEHILEPYEKKPEPKLKKYVVRCEKLERYVQEYECEAESPEEARRLCEQEMDGDGDWYVCYAYDGDIEERIVSIDEVKEEG